MESFPWEPPDGWGWSSGAARGCIALDGRGQSAVWVVADDGVDGGVPTSRSEFEASCGLGRGGHGWEVRPGRPRDVHHGAAGTPPAGKSTDLGVAGAGGPLKEVAQLDLGLRDTTRFSSYSKLWRTLYFVNDAPFRIRKFHGFANGPGREWAGPPDQSCVNCRRQLGAGQFIAASNAQA